MTSNRFPVNSAAINALSPIGVPLVYPAAPAVVCTWRALRAEEMIAKDGGPGLLRTLTGKSIAVTISMKGLRAKGGDTPMSFKMRRGFVSYCALERKGFTDAIKKGDVIDAKGSTWHIEDADLQEVEGDKIRWMLIMEQSY